MSTNEEPLAPRAERRRDSARHGLVPRQRLSGHAAGRLKTIKLGGRRLIPSEAIDALLRNGAAGK